MCVLLCLCLPASAAPWPRVEAFTREVTIDFTGGVTALDMDIRAARNGAAVYVLRCRAGSDQLLDALAKRDGVNWVAPLLCLLDEANAPLSERTLLAEDDSPPWHTRGQFHAADLLDACGDYPEFGRDRSFRLRGFLLRLRAKDVRMKPGGALDRLTLQILVANAPGATAHRAAPPGYRRPIPGQCATVRKGRDPRLCRIASGPQAGSWAPCPD